MSSHAVPVGPRPFFDVLLSSWCSLGGGGMLCQMDLVKHISRHVNPDDIDDEQRIV